MKSASERLDDLLREANIPVLFGLRQQGHIPTVRRMLAEGKSWTEIGDVIGWEAEAAERWYRIEMAPAVLFLEGAKWLADACELKPDLRRIYGEARRRYPEEDQ